MKLDPFRSSSTTRMRIPCLAHPTRGLCSGERRATRDLQEARFVTMDPSAGDGLLSPLAYAREDESSDERFYVMPRRVVHIDDGAIAALGRLYADVLPADGRLLDLMSSWRSHLPSGFRSREVVGLGMNA